MYENVDYDSINNKLINKTYILYNLMNKSTLQKCFLTLKFRIFIASWKSVYLLKILLFYHVLLSLDKQTADEVLSVVRDRIEGLILQVVVGTSDVGEGFGVVVAHERGQTG